MTRRQTTSFVQKIDFARRVSKLRSNRVTKLVKYKDFNIRVCKNWPNIMRTEAHNIANVRLMS